MEEKPLDAMLFGMEDKVVVDWLKPDMLLRVRLLLPLLLWLEEVSK